MRLVSFLLCIMLMSTLSSAQDAGVNLDTILRECTSAKTTCKNTETVCTEYSDTVSSEFSWTGLKILLGVVVSVMATWFTVLVLYSFIRYTLGMMNRKRTVGYVQQLESTNKNLMQTIERLNAIMYQVETENEKLIRAKTILSDILENNIKPVQPVQSETIINTQKTLPNIGRLLTIMMAILFIITLIISYVGII